VGYRTLSLELVLRALFLDDRAFDELRDDDNPFVEGLFLVVIISVVTALLVLVGQLLAWASAPRLADVKTVFETMLQQMSWWGPMSANPQALASFQQIWDGAWRVIPTLFGAPDPRAAAINVIMWPASHIAIWLIYGLLAHAFARLLRGTGTLTQTLGTTSLAFSPWLLHGLQVIPFLVLGGVVTTWQLILRYKAIRSAHRLPWDRAMWATLLPFLVALALAFAVGAFLSAIVALVLGGR
jgi:hypothetical protein